LAKPIRGRSGLFSRPILPRQPLASFGNTVVGFDRGGCHEPHWLRSGKRTPPRVTTVSELNTSKLVLASFGETAVADAIGFVRGKPCPRSNNAFRNQTHYKGSMGSFGQTDSRAIWPFSRPILPRQPLASFGNTVVGFVRGGCREPHWLRSGKRTPPRVTTVSELNTSKLILASFGEMGSWPIASAFSTHHPGTAIGFVW
jgi:hypothetical protein